MPRCRVDQSIERVEVDGFAFPLGVYPVEAMTPAPGYTLDFEPADGDDSGETEEWEEWPDRYVFDILVSATRVESLCRSLFALLPGRVYPILDVLGHDAYREVDPYVSYDLVGLDRFLDTIRRYRGYFFEDGLVGFGAMSEEPFLYVFVDEHKIVTVRAESALKEKIEHLLAAFDLREVPEIRGADASTHEHRGVLDAPDERLDLLNADEIVEELRDSWRLSLNIDPDRNLDADGNELGITGWRCIVRYDPKPEEQKKGESGAITQQTFPPPRYCEVLLTADTLSRAMDLAFEGFDEVAADTPDISGETEAEPVIVATDRLSADDFAAAVREAREKSGSSAQIPDKRGSEKAGSEKAGSEKAGSEKAGSEKAGSEKAASEKAGAERGVPDKGAEIDAGATGARTPASAKNAGEEAGSAGDDDLALTGPVDLGDSRVWHACWMR